MYTVSLYRNGIEILKNFDTETLALNYASLYWHLDPIVTGPDNKCVTLCENGLFKD